MSETAGKASPANQDPLFGYGPAYGDTIRPIEEPTHDTYVQPEQPKPLLEMSAQEMIQVAMQDRLTPDIHGFFDPKRGEFIRHFHWTPYSDQEATMAIGFDRHFLHEHSGLTNYLLAAHKRGGQAAAKAVVDTVDRARIGSTMAIETLGEARDEDIGQFIPSAVRNNEAVRQFIAREVFARNSLNLYEWPRHHLERTKRVRTNPKVDKQMLAIADGLRFLNDEDLKTVCDKTYGHLRARAHFWSREYEKAKDHPDSADLIANANSRY